MQSQTLPQGYSNDPAAAFQRMQQKARLDGDDLRMLALLEVSGEDYALPPDEQNPFIQSLRTAAPQIEVTDAFLAGLAAGERPGEVIYGRWAAGEPDAEVAKLYRQTAGEELMHAERLEDARKLFAAASP
ncbi:MAG: hypothetical protein U1F11_09015 [Steroidobacteraceae bacterium]